MSKTGKLLTKGSVLKLTQVIATAVIGFFMMPFLIHNFGDNDYGMWVLVGTIIGLFSLLDAGLAGVTQRFLVRAIHGENDSEINNVISTSFYSLLIISVLIITVSIIIALVGGNYVSTDHNRQLFQKVLVILALGMALSLPWASYYGLITAKYRFDVLTYVSLSIFLFKTALIVVFVLNDYSIVALAFITLVTQVLEKICVRYIAYRYYPHIGVNFRHYDKSTLLALLAYSKWVFVAKIADRLRFTIDDLVVASIVGISAVTHYTIAVTLVAYFGEIMGSVFGVIGPSLNKYHKLNDWDSIRKVFDAVNEMTSISSVLIVSVLLFFGDDLILLWIGAGYDDSYMVLVILSFSSLIAYSQRASVATLFAIAKHKYYSIITLIEAIANLVLSVSLAMSYGVYGVALGTAIPIFISKIFIQPPYVCKQLGISKIQYYRLYFYRLLLLALASLLSYFCTISIEIHSYLSLATCAVIYCCIFIVLTVKFILSDESIALLEQMLHLKIYSAILKLKRI